ncbi:activity-dependent neuroprotector homeobox protein 2 isoform X4 [Parus major]|uniref:activity-dependent neuroprotector homeobox protein 2 isoform X4 n=1 Tax=Parus major TaxID=9157 RepID=UPI0014445271|nr:activity-dependent neuroprotector homeobox protein 2 isoform X4 [Parus major]
MFQIPVQNLDNIRKARKKVKDILVDLGLDNCRELLKNLKSFDAGESYFRNTSWSDVSPWEPVGRRKRYRTKPYCCSLCKFSSKLLTSFKNHLHRCHEDEIDQEMVVSCPKCTFSSHPKVVGEHIWMFHSSNKRIQNYTVSILDGMKQFRSDIINFTCLKCQFTDTLYYNMKRHVLMNHFENLLSVYFGEKCDESTPNSFEFYCKKCNAPANNPDSLMYHVLTAETHRDLENKLRSLISERLKKPGFVKQMYIAPKPVSGVAAAAPSAGPAAVPTGAVTAPSCIQVAFPQNNQNQSMVQTQAVQNTVGPVTVPSASGSLPQTTCAPAAMSLQVALVPSNPPVAQNSLGIQPSPSQPVVVSHGLPLNHSVGTINRTVAPAVLPLNQPVRPGLFPVNQPIGTINSPVPAGTLPATQPVSPVNQPVAPGVLPVNQPVAPGILSVSQSLPVTQTVGSGLLQLNQPVASGVVPVTQPVGPGFLQLNQPVAPAVIPVNQPVQPPVSQSTFYDLKSLVEHNKAAHNGRKQLHASYSNRGIQLGNDAQGGLVFPHFDFNTVLPDEDMGEREVHLAVLVGVYSTILVPVYIKVKPQTAQVNRRCTRKMFTCPFCLGTFAGRETYEKHLKERHHIMPTVHTILKSPAFKCIHCCGVYPGNMTLTAIAVHLLRCRSAPKDTNSSLKMQLERTERKELLFVNGEKHISVLLKRKQSDSCFVTEDQRNKEQHPLGLSTGIALSPENEVNSGVVPFKRQKIRTEMRKVPSSEDFRFLAVDPNQYDHNSYEAQRQFLSDYFHKRPYPSKKEVELLSLLLYAWKIDVASFFGKMRNRCLRSIKRHRPSVLMGFSMSELKNIKHSLNLKDGPLDV